ncbi:unnamed protein product [Rangifer tarandus platyrhynchus]|uniref:Uncharacterized protein n=1 Tax=Rangifer tarandus platyrhynchus TaxID=3082113 RepID=A0AC59YI61_RANTA
MSTVSPRPPALMASQQHPTHALPEQPGPRSQPHRGSLLPGDKQPEVEGSGRGHREEGLRPGSGPAGAPETWERASGPLSAPRLGAEQESVESTHGTSPRPFGALDVRLCGCIAGGDPGLGTVLSPCPGLVRSSQEQACWANGEGHELGLLNPVLWGLRSAEAAPLS